MASRRLAKSLPSVSTLNSLRRNTDLDHIPKPVARFDLSAVFDPSSPSAVSSAPPLPTLSLSAAAPSRLIRFLESHLPPSFTPADLLRLLSCRLRHHPAFAPYDLHVFQWAAGVDSFRHDHSTYEWMARTLAVTDRLGPLRLLLHRMLAQPCPCADGIFACPRIEPIIGFAIHAFCRAGRLDDAISAFEDSRRSVDGRPGVALYNTLINGFARRREYQKAKSLYDRMVKDRVKPDTFTFNILISSCLRCSDLNSALDWFREMRARGCEPNVVSFNTLIRGFFKEKKFKEGIGVAREMLELGYGFSVASCDILMDGLCKDGKSLEASKLLEEFLQKGALPNGFDCFVLVEAFCKDGGSAGRALEVVDSLWGKGNFCSEVTCSTLIEGLRSSGKINDACGLLERMLQKEMLPDTITFNTLLETLCDIGRTSDANRLRVIASKKGFKPDTVTFGILAHGFSREGRKTEGESIINEMLDAGFIPNIATYNTLMDRLPTRKNPSSRQIVKARINKSMESDVAIIC
ncbi:pentatricopeptide repeat-containing protein At2g36240-like [Zingiber officinale]|uniref:pentatricopeptide repeat-containing protein At2g36240-like n=1 Tax=Zingiber officinale TaxID=94328 RepID=UPI001C4A8FC1|nr:pentatricopeptide repeat-containing protein At2g36240-like [Zingiber officinale]